MVCLPLKWSVASRHRVLFYGSGQSQVQVRVVVVTLVTESLGGLVNAGYQASFAELMELLMLLVQGPHFENYWARGLFVQWDWFVLLLLLLLNTSLIWITKITGLGCVGVREIKKFRQSFLYLELQGIIWQNPIFEFQKLNFTLVSVVSFSNKPLQVDGP